VTDRKSAEHRGARDAECLTLAHSHCGREKMPGPSFDIQGHRGARGVSPENTLPGFARALEIGVSTLEFDCAITADGIVVVSHDAALNPDITRLDGRWIAQRGPAINTLSYAALSRYDVGAIRPDSAYARPFPMQQPLDDVHIPRLADVFALTVATRAEHVRFNIETKIDPTQPQLSVGPEAFVHAIMAEVIAAGMKARTTIQSFDWRTLAIVQREFPDVTTACLTTQRVGDDNVLPTRDRASPWTNGLHFYDYRSVPKMVHAAGGSIWSPRFQDLDSATIADARTLGLAVIPWTVNEREDMARLIDWGVNGLISDYPHRLREVLEAKKMPLPPQVHAPA
jgi:glycerophosphoryl diester phosphodiesterase